MIYIVLLFLLFISSVAEAYAKLESEKKIAYLLRYTSFIFMFCLAAFRYETGGDWPGYKGIYDGGRENVESGFMVIVQFARLIGHYQYILIFTMILRYICLYIFIKNYCLKVLNNFSLFLLIYYCMFYFHDDFISIRQCLACSIFLLCYCSKNKISFKKYLIIVLLASTVHVSSIVFIIFYPFIFKVSSKKMIIFTFVILCMSVLSIDLIKNIIKILYGVLPSNFILTMAYQYCFNPAIGFKRKLTGQSYVYIFLFIMLITQQIKIFSKKSVNTYINSICLFYMFYFGLINYFVISLRFCMFVNLFIVLYVASLISENLRKNILISAVLLLLAFAFNKNIFLMDNSARAYLPYQNYYISTALGLPSDGLKRLSSLESNEHLKKE